MPSVICIWEWECKRGKRIHVSVSLVFLFSSSRTRGWDSHIFPQLQLKISEQQLKTASSRPALVVFVSLASMWLGSTVRTFRCDALGCEYSLWIFFWSFVVDDHCVAAFNVPWVVYQCYVIGVKFNFNYTSTINTINTSLWYFVLLKEAAKFLHSSLLKQYPEML